MRLLWWIVSERKRNFWQMNFTTNCRRDTKIGCEISIFFIVLLVNEPPELILYLCTMIFGDCLVERGWLLQLQVHEFVVLMLKFGSESWFFVVHFGFWVEVEPTKSTKNAENNDPTKAMLMMDLRCGLPTFYAKVIQASSCFKIRNVPSL